MFETIVYMLCEGIGRIKGKKIVGIKNSDLKKLTLTSGESPSTADTLRKNYGRIGKIN